MSLAEEAGPIIEAAIPGLHLERTPGYVFVPDPSGEMEDNTVPGFPPSPKGEWVATGKDTYRNWGVVPVQANGTLPDGRQFYFRFRGNTASLETWPADRPMQDFGLPEGQATHVATLYDVTDDRWAGSFDSTEQAVDVFLRLHAALAPADADTNPNYPQRIGAIIDAMAEGTPESKSDD